MKFLKPAALYVLAISLATTCLALLFEAFKAYELELALEAETPAEKSLVIRNWKRDIKKLTASMDYSEDVRRANYFVSDPGVALTNNKIQDRIDFIRAQQEIFANAWDILIPPATA